MSYTFESILKDEFQEHLALRMKAGRGFEPEQCALANLDRFLVSSGVSIKALPESLMMDWLADMNAKPQTRRWRLQAISPMIKYLRSIDIIAHMPEKPRAVSEYVPYIFSGTEFSRIIETADNRQSGFKATPVSASAQMPFLLRLLYGCGLRLGEALSLKWKDVDLENAVILIRFAKNEKQRIAPMSASLNELCKLYRASELTYGEDGDYLFSNRKGGHYSLALRSFSKMESEGCRFVNSVPYLSTYLGHSSIMETDKYLRFSHEIYKDAHVSLNIYTQGVFPEVSYE